ncbi:MAG: recombinase family protein [Thermoleophilia bacterium]|nr:recombinase family protein [Thermoleophilia bacterium]
MQTVQTVGVKRVATYERVSSEDQKRRETIKTQTQEIARRLETDPGVVLVNRYVDDGVSGMIPMGKRPDGARLFADAAKGLFDTVWVYSVDRLGRGWVDPEVVWEDLEKLGVGIYSVSEEVSDRLVYHIMAGVAAKKRADFLAASAAGMRRAVQEGRYVGGIAPYGYRVQGEGHRAFLIPDDTIVWGDMSAVGIVCWAYELLGTDGWSCPKIVDEFNRLGIPTAYQKDGRGVRGQRVQGLWRPGRICNLVRNPVYKGELQYGKRSKKPKDKQEIVTGKVAALVPEELWQAAQETLSRNRVCAKNTTYRYLLRSKIVCGTCGLAFVGTRTHGTDVWYRCNGYLRYRGPIEGKCTSKAVKGEHLEPLVWADIENWLRNPGTILEELRSEATGNPSQALLEAERITLTAAVQEHLAERERVLYLFQRAFITTEELEERLKRLDTTTENLQQRLAALEPQEAECIQPAQQDLLAALRMRLDEGLSDEERQEIVQLLVRRITVFTDVSAEGSKKLRTIVEYRLPEPDLEAVSTSTGRGSSPRPGCTPPGRPTSPPGAR